ncbi:hypothetical protein BDZ97DRAFT_1779883 [Flammula alnicola]|nr:hypothetical protein BDZ97DRAFT_1779883 [Flammula alnicola]
MSVDDETSGWQLTESDPGVFTELLKSLGLPLIVDDLYSLEPDSLAALQPLHALIFLFKWIPTSSSDNTATQRVGTDEPDFPGFFAHQVVNNAYLLQFTQGMDPQTRGLVITKTQSLSPPSAFSLDGLGLPKKTEDAYHFVVYVPSGEGWLKTAREVIEARINTYPVGALEFSLLALRDDPLPSLQSELEHYQSIGNSSMASEILSRIHSENAKRERWAFENSLRRHNHVGLVQALLLALAQGGKLSSAEEAAKKVMKERIEQRKARGGDMDED